MMYLILTLLVYQAESKYFLTEHEEGPVKHHLLTIQDPADTPVTKDHPKIGEGSSNRQSGQVRSGQVREHLMREIIFLTVNYYSSVVKIKKMVVMVMITV